MWKLKDWYKGAIITIINGDYTGLRHITAEDTSPNSKKLSEGTDLVKHNDMKVLTRRFLIDLAKLTNLNNTDRAKGITNWKTNRNVETYGAPKP